MNATGVFSLAMQSLDRKKKMDTLALSCGNW